MKGYEAYAGAVDILKAAGKEQSLEDYVNVQAYGTPQQILDKLEKRREVVGDFEWSVMMSYAGMPHEEVEKSMRLFGKEVLPEVKKLGRRNRRIDKRVVCNWKGTKAITNAHGSSPGRHIVPSNLRDK